MSSSEPAEHFAPKSSDSPVKMRKTFSFMKIFIASFLTLLFALSVLAQRQAEVTVMSTYLRKEPDSSSEKIQTIRKGDKVILEKTREKDGWLYVSTENGSVKGWVRTDTISSPVKPASIPTKSDNAAPVRQRVVPAQNTKPVVSQTPAPVKTTVNPVNPPNEVEEVIKVDTEEVNLNVRVVDANNRAVKNLRLSDFKVYEDGILQPLASLNTTEIPTINALVIDNSRSLRSQLKDIIEAGKIIVAQNRAADESAIIRFVSADKFDVVQDFTTRKSSLIQGLDNLYVEGGQTAIIDAVYQAAKKIDEYQKSTRKDDVKLRALILVSDGDDRSTTHDEVQLFELLRNSQVQIYAVGFVNELSNEPDADGINRQEKAKIFLNRLTEETGGKVYFPNSIGELPQIAADISAELHTQYLISYTPTNESRNGNYRKIKVTVNNGENNEKRFAIARAGRISAPK